MSITKFITCVNWILISIYGGYVIWALLQASKPSHEMPGVESIIKGAAVFLLLLMIGLNISSNQWMKFMGLILAIIMLLVVRHIAEN